MKVISLCWLTAKEQDLCKRFYEFNTVPFKQKLLQLVLWNKQGPFKEQGYNGFPQIDVLFNFSRVNHRLLVIMDGCNKCCEINTVSLTWGLLQVLPWNNDIIINKMDGWKRCHTTDFFQYMDAWNQGGIIISISISILATISVLQKHSKFERMSDCNYSFTTKKGNSLNGWLDWTWLTASASLKETQHP